MNAKLNADLHCHSTVSDGLLAPAEVVRRAHANGVELLALTDHDELGGVAPARAEAERLGVKLISGVEISVSWGDDVTLHLLGLGVDADNAVLARGLADVRTGRDERARRIAVELDAVGIHGAYAGALRYVGNPALLSRAHFARFIVDEGLAADVSGVFDHWLAKGKPGYVPHRWASLDNALEWIVAAGGIAVLAHPGRYPLGRREAKRLFAEFKERGGAGIEVVTGSHSAEEVRNYATIARRYGLLASRASDFHGPGESWFDLGRIPDLPDGLDPVWGALV